MRVLGSAPVRLQVNLHLMWKRQYDFSGALEFGQFEPGRLFPSGVAGFLSESFELVSSRNHHETEMLGVGWDHGVRVFGGAPVRVQVPRQSGGRGNIF